MFDEMKLLALCGSNHIGKLLICENLTNFSVNYNTIFDIDKNTY